MQNVDWSGLRVVLVTTDEPIYLPIALQRLLERPAGRSIRRIVLLPPTSGRRNWRVVAAEQLRFGLRWFAVRLTQFLFYGKFLAPLGIRWRGRWYSVPAVARAFGVPCTFVERIGSPEAEALIRREDPHLLLSLAASQIFPERILSLPRWASLNVHNAPLPRYQGLMPSFWVLRHGETETAITVHKMVPKLDSGDVVLQERVPIRPEDTLDSLIRRTKEGAAEALEKAFRLFVEHDGEPPAKPLDLEKATYFGAPTREDVRAFRATGRRLL